MVYIITSLPIGTGKFPVFIPLVFDRLFGYESGTETSKALGLHNLPRFCFRGCKAAQIVHK